MHNALYKSSVISLTHILLKEIMVSKDFNILKFWEHVIKLFNRRFASLCTPAKHPWKYISSSLHTPISVELRPSIVMWKVTEHGKLVLLSIPLWGFLLLMGWLGIFLPHSWFFPISKFIAWALLTSTSVFQSPAFISCPCKRMAHHWRIQASHSFPWDHSWVWCFHCTLTIDLLSELTVPKGAVESVFYRTWENKGIKQQSPNTQVCQCSV